MELTIQEVHTYNNLVKQGRAEKLKLSGVDDDAIVITRLDENDKVYFYDIVSKAHVYPGLNNIQKIKNAIDSQKIY